MTFYCWYYIFFVFLIFNPIHQSGNLKIVTFYCHILYRVSWTHQLDWKSGCSMRSIRSFYLVTCIGHKIFLLYYCDPWGWLLSWTMWDHKSFLNSCILLVLLSHYMGVHASTVSNKLYEYSIWINFVSDSNVNVLLCSNISIFFLF